MSKGKFIFRFDIYANEHRDSRYSFSLRANLTDKDCTLSVARLERVSESSSSYILDPTSITDYYFREFPTVHNSIITQIHYHIIDTLNLAEEFLVYVPEHPDLALLCSSDELRQAIAKEIGNFNKYLQKKPITEATFGEHLQRAKEYYASERPILKSDTI